MQQEAQREPRGITQEVAAPRDYELFSARAADGVICAQLMILTELIPDGLPPEKVACLSDGIAEYEAKHGLSLPLPGRCLCILP